MPTVNANGTQLYYERRGGGPSVLFISGATGDAGHFTKVAGLLADEFTVVTYDRRGNSRSPRPAGWTTTSMDEQADDAAALLQALDLAPAAVFGTSGGGVILLNLLLRRPEVLRGALVHEPPLLAVLPGGAELGAQFQVMTEEALATGGPRGAMELFIRFNAGDASFERLEPALRERMLGNADVFFSAELEPFVTYVPDAAALGRIGVPVHALAGVEHRDADFVHNGYLYQSARWVADRLRSNLAELPGAHAPYFDRPRELAAALRPLLRQVSEMSVITERGTMTPALHPRRHDVTGGSAG
jgi:pimeloyl-ACP methyl ester carboxylesterase